MQFKKWKYVLSYRLAIIYGIYVFCCTGCRTNTSSSLNCLKTLICLKGCILTLEGMKPHHKASLRRQKLTLLTSFPLSSACCWKGGNVHLRKKWQLRFHADGDRDRSLEWRKKADGETSPNWLLAGWMTPIMGAGGRWTEERRCKGTQDGETEMDKLLIEVSAQQEKAAAHHGFIIFLLNTPFMFYLALSVSGGALKKPPTHPSASASVRSHLHTLISEHMHLIS